MSIFSVILIAITSSFSVNNNLLELSKSIPDIISTINSTGFAGCHFFTNKIQHQKLLCGVDGESDFYYFDFRDSNGFILFDHDGAIINLSDCGDFPQIVDSNDVFVDGFDIVANGEKVDTTNSLVTNVWSAGSIASQYGEAIEYYELSQFISSKYSLADFELMSSGKLPGLALSCSNDGYLQSEEAVYYFEGNCGLVSMANILAYKRSYQNLVGIPAKNSVSYIPQSLIDSANFQLSQKTPPVPVHEICADLWCEAISCGYDGLGMNDTITVDMLSGMLHSYGYSCSFTTSYSYTLSYLTSNIDSGKTFQLRTIDDVVYHGHGMMITGYRTYKADVFIDRLHARLYLVFVSVFDGQSQNERWYDLTYLENLGPAYSRADSQSLALVEVF